MALFQKNPSRVLVLAPHADDAELGAGGFIASVSETSEIRYVVMSSCEESLPPGLPPDTLEKECLRATKTIGVSKDAVSFERFQVRFFHQWRQEILERLIKIREDFRPELVLTPAGTDIHQDHSVVHDETRRAFKHCSILGYELPWNSFTMSVSFYAALHERDMRRKLAAIKKYRSQAGRPYGDGRSMLSLAELRGSQVGVQYAEGFEVIRLLW